jgi:hypothetical protein
VGVVAAPVAASASAPTCDWHQNNCNFILVSNRSDNVGVVCEKPFDAQDHPAGKREFDKIGWNDVSRYWIPPNAAYVKFKYRYDMPCI